MEKQSCKNCRYFVQYYCKRLTELVPVNYGYCKENYFAVKKKKDFPFINGCELWKPAEGMKERRQEGIEKVIRDMQNHLEQISVLLQNESEQ